MWTGWVMGDTPQTVTTTRAPCDAKNKYKKKEIRWLQKR